MQSKVETTVRLSEPVPIGETFATGFGVEDCGDFFRIVYYSEQPAIGFDVTERVVVLKVVMTAARYRAMAGLMIASPSITL